ncbi:hypothetical protein VM1G_11283 [Cytospora mali]|uniref:Uncharacterized protein n=1 Tax=Cytospora mali TaxID=578113 RepID=A0A194VMB0_CYTMA|nr:hypothetical protein VM1G_11283 [Valsa mali]
MGPGWGGHKIMPGQFPTAQRSQHEVGLVICRTDGRRGELTIFNEEAVTSDTARPRAFLGYVA